MGEKTCSAYGSREQKYQREIIRGQSLHEEELLRVRAFTWDGWNMKHLCIEIVQKETKKTSNWEVGARVEELD